ncbi:transmembrane protein, putative [Medicago truncatula]|uniref:Transmembrane protein, putative n=1 Tax=Medicago truncatula TaxID=3880 RepID=G7KQU1_MEDTR|nr:transmembrane protein, putative [Medicago truncatula]
MEVKALGAWGVSLEKGDNGKVWLGALRIKAGMGDWLSEVIKKKIVKGSATFFGKIIGVEINALKFIYPWLFAISKQRN